MTHRPNAITHKAYSGVYSAARGGTVYIYYFRSFYETKPVPLDTKFWRLHYCQRFYSQKRCKKI